MAGESGAATITLISSDDTRFEVPEAAALLSQTVRRLIEEGGGRRAGVHGGVPLPEVDATTLAKVIEYCNKHAPAAVPAAAAAAVVVDKQDLDSFDREFTNVDVTTLYSLLMAGDYLQIRGLLELAGKATADLIRVNPLEEASWAVYHLQVTGLMELACRAIADLVRYRPVEEVRLALGITDSGFTAEEEEVRRENAWAFE